LDENEDDQVAYEQKFTPEYLAYAKNVSEEFRKMKEFDRYRLIQEKM
jgi:hypothetical protein